MDLNVNYTVFFFFFCKRGISGETKTNKKNTVKNKGTPGEFRQSLYTSYLQTPAIYCLLFPKSKQSAFLVSIIPNHSLLTVFPNINQTVFTVEIPKAHCSHPC